MPYINELLLGFGTLFVVAGLIGCVVPFLIGPMLSFAGILLLHFSKYGEFSTTFLIILGCLTLVSSVLDNILPVIGVKNTGGTNRAVTGSIIGLIVGIFILPPLGLIIFPFLGALIAELTTGRKFLEALRTSFGSFIGLILGIVLKLAVSGTIIYYFAKEILKYFNTH
jgi:uncharacterized protein YqgC (DUF456 family)